MMAQIQRFTGIYIIDKIPPTRIAFLTRTKGRYAGGLDAGIGGSYEEDKDDTTLESAQRELKEEVPDWADTELFEFAQCNINDRKILHYFCGFRTGKIPLADSREGVLHWVEEADIFERNLFPTNVPVLGEWKRRGYAINNPFTIYLVGDTDSEGITRNVVVKKIRDGLELNL